MPKVNIQNKYVKDAFGVRRGWTKLVKDVDTTKDNGFAFLGNFLSSGIQDLPIGSILVQKNPEGNFKQGWHSAVCLQVLPDGRLRVVSQGLSWSRDFLRFREIVLHWLNTEEYEGAIAKKILEKYKNKNKLLSQFTDEELLAECQRRLAMAEVTENAK